MPDTSLQIEHIHPPDAPVPGACAALDPRIRRTRELLQKSLANLLEKNDFEQISVHEITDSAGVNRATFYAHYTDKFQLLECMVATRFGALLNDRGIVVQGGCTNALRGMVLGVCDYLADYTASPCGAVRAMQPHMETAIIAVVRRMLLDGMASHGGNDDDVRLRASAMSWAIFGAAREWVNTPGHASSEQIATIVTALIAPLLSEPAA